MTDIVERLRSGIDWRDYEDPGDTVDWMDEAADEIERLREQVLAQQHIANRNKKSIEEIMTYNTKLENYVIYLEGKQ